MTSNIPDQETALANINIKKMKITHKKTFTESYEQVWVQQKWSIT